MVEEKRLKYTCNTTGTKDEIIQKEELFIEGKFDVPCLKSESILHDTSVSFTFTIK